MAHEKRAIVTMRNQPRPTFSGPNSP